jgi:hypothetical protein
MSGVGVVWARAPSLEKLEMELTRQLARCSAEDVVGVSHSTAVVSSKQSGGIWGAASHRHEVEYSAVVLLRQ